MVVDRDEINAIEELKSALDPRPDVITFRVEADHIVDLYCYISKDKKIPESITGLKYLKRIQVTNIPIERPGPFPEPVVKLHSLEEFTGGLFTRVPKSIANLRNLTLLNLGIRCQIPATIGELSKLRKIRLGYDYLAKIPEGLLSCMNLQELNLSQNKIDLFPADIAKLKNLQVLDLSHNEITAVPPEIGELKMLRNLRLNNNKITSLPSEICTLGNLGIFDLSNNVLTSFPSESPITMSSLEWLDLTGNRLGDDVDFTPFTSVEHLRLGGNAFTRLPRLPAPPGVASLRFLDIDGNPGLKVTKAELKEVVKAYSNLQIYYTGARGFTEAVVSP